MTPCPNCNNRTFNYQQKIPTHHSAYSDQSELVQCSSCSLYFVSPPPDEQKLAELYSGSYHYSPQPLQEFLVNVWASFELTLDESLVDDYKHSGAILDIGAGRGDFLLKFDPDAWQMWAYDPYLSSEDIDRLKKKIGQHVNDHQTLEAYPENLYDVVLLRNVIEHTTQFNPLLKNIYRVLKPGGILFIRTPNIDAVDFEKFKTDWYVISMPGHMVFFSPQTLKATLEKVGFTTKYAKGVRYSPPLSLLRSDKTVQSLYLKYLRSLAFTVQPIFNARGGDLQAIAQK